MSNYYDDEDDDELEAKLAAAEAKNAELERQVKRLEAKVPKPAAPDPYAEAIANAQSPAEVIALVREHGGLVADGTP